MTTKEAIKQLFELFDDQDIIRNTEKDNDFEYFTKQSVKINNVIATLKYELED